MRYPAKYEQAQVRGDIYDDVLKRIHTLRLSRIEYKELTAQVSSVINTLPEKCREVYKLSREECLSHKQIASQFKHIHKNGRKTIWPKHCDSFAPS